MDELFRFASLRSPESVDPSLPLGLDADSDLQGTLLGIVQRTALPAPSGPRLLRPFAMMAETIVSVARDFMRSPMFVSDVAKLKWGKQIVALLGVLGHNTPTSFAALASAISAAFGKTAAELAADSSFHGDITTAKDSLLAAYLAPEGHTLPMTGLADAVRVTDIVLRVAANDTTLSSAKAIHQALRRPLVLPAAIFPKDPTKVQPVGVADLLVVRQHIKSYELKEIQNIENILLGESRRKTARHTTVASTTSTTSTTTTTETIQEQQTTERFSLQNEIDKTLKEDLAIKAGASVAYHGGTVDANANFSLDYSNSKSESQKIATDYAKETVSRASKKVTQTIQQSIVQQFTETFDTLEDHSFDNTGGQGNVSGVYQWVDAINEAQVFNYGRRLLYDLMVPEPAAQWLDAFATRPATSPVPVPPPAFDVKLVAIDPSSYGTLATAYRAEGVPPPPVSQLSASGTSVMTSQQGASDQVSTIKIPDGYEATSAWVSGNFDWSSEPDGIGVFLGSVSIPFKQNDPPFQQELATPLIGEIPFGVHGYHVANYSLTVQVICQPSQDSIAAWKQTVFDKLLAGWNKWNADYMDALANQQQQAASQPDLELGGNPDDNAAVIRTELKRGVLQMMLGNFDYELTETSTGGAQYPHPKLPDAIQLGEMIRFFEQAFEWEQVSYVLYPYFWGRKSTWYDRLRLTADDPSFLAFLRAGSARVVVPVRPGFEPYLQYYFITGMLWNGSEPPQVVDANYLPIAQEIADATGASKGEVPYGDPWDVILPTTFVRLRADNASLPTWTRPDPTKWTWQDDAGDPPVTGS